MRQHGTLLVGETQSITLDILPSAVFTPYMITVPALHNETVFKH